MPSPSVSPPSPPLIDLIGPLDGGEGEWGGWVKGWAGGLWTPFWLNRLLPPIFVTDLLPLVWESVFWKFHIGGHVCFGGNLPH